MTAPRAGAARPIPQRFLERLGLGEGACDVRFAWRLVLAALLLYALGFACFYPRTPTNTDEAMYVRQAELILAGERTVVREDPLSGEQERFWPSTYWVGPALMMLPFVWLSGWRGAFVAPCLGLLLGVLFTGRGLQAEGRSPIFALLVLGFLPALVMGRVAMSDAPSLGVVALGLWLFWRGIDGRPRWWLGSGFVAGVSLAFRVTNVLIFAPFFAGSVLRRERKSWALLVGGLLGLGVRLLLMHFYFGNPFAERGAYLFHPQTLHERLPLYLLGLLVLVPGGLVFAFAYRGRRRAELLGCVALTFCFYLFQQFSTDTTGWSKRLVLALRYFIPLLPVLAYGMAESLPRLWRRLLERSGAGRRRRLEALGATLVALWIAGVAAAAVSVHPVMGRWAAHQAEISDALHAIVPVDVPIVTNWPATRKFLRPLQERYDPVHRAWCRPEHVATLLERHGAFFLVLLDRSDSAYWRRDAEANQTFVDALAGSRELLLDRRFTPTDRLRIWRITP